MRKIRAFIDIEDHECIQTIPKFKPVYDYIKKSKVEPREWGKLCFEDVEIVFYSYSDLKKLIDVGEKVNTIGQ